MKLILTLVEVARIELASEGGGLFSSTFVVSLDITRT